MRATRPLLLITAAALALAAAPAALAKGSVTIGSSTIVTLQGVQSHLATVTVTRKDKLRSCQVGDNRSRVIRTASPAGETQRKAATVACEQPPRSAPNLPGMKSAEAAALIAAG